MFPKNTKLVVYDNTKEKEEHKSIMIKDGWRITSEQALYIIWKK
jgi:hypothetical protein